LNNNPPILPGFGVPVAYAFVGIAKWQT